ncbi:TonB-dependent receptor family protein [Chitinophaga costaii]|nr:TonB-dependent receptor plug domain-containing protein [Chitinophaga costaii]
MCFKIWLLCCGWPLTSMAQRDTAIHLSEVQVTGFAADKKLMNQSSSITYIGQGMLDRYANTSPVSAVNSMPGVRMEERSPGSYRLNVRGSTLRSPFGVRNIKVYYNGIPYTDPGGNTYLNQLAFDNITDITIIKGPGGSLYGAGSGGVMLLKSALFSDSMHTASIGFTGGSNGLRSFQAALNWGEDGRRNTLRYSDLQSDGYRDHSAMHRQVVSYETVVKNTDKQQLSVYTHYANLFYETPGALTLAEYQANPRAARPAAGSNPSAVAAKAAIHQQTFFAGLRNTYTINAHWDNTTAVYGAFTNFSNPAIRNVEDRLEPHFGGRSVLRWYNGNEYTQYSVMGGIEAQQGFFGDKVYQNKGGVSDSIQTDDEIHNFTANVFLQGDVTFTHGWSITAGASLNYGHLFITRHTPAPVFNFKSSYHGVLAPRIAIAKQWLGDRLVVYGNVSKGFSPPATQEVLPSTSVINTNLQPEEGVDYELGTRGRWLHGKLYYDVNAFIFNLSQSISQRRDSSGADYYVNAGGTRQHGLEAYLSYDIYDKPMTAFSYAGVWGSFTGSRFFYRGYKVIGSDFTGNRLPGVPNESWSAGLDARLRAGVQLHLTYTSNSKIPVNDANSEYAKAYHLLGLRLQYTIPVGQHLQFAVNAGADNLLDETYSLGNDINATGGRYYNAAPGRNYYAGLVVKGSGKKKDR